MTTIAWDGKTLAVDSRVIGGNMIRDENFQKLWKIHDFWLAGAGDTQDVLAAVAWFRAGMPGNDKPKFNDPNNVAIIVKVGRTAKRYEGSLIGWELPRIAAAGSGFEVAIGAMAMGATAVQAVKIAARFDPGTNSRVRYSR